MSESLEGIKAACKERIRQVISHFSTLETVRNSLQARVDSAIDQISSPSSINGRFLEENITLKRFFVGKIVKSDTLKALIGASLILVKYFSYLLHADLVPILDASQTFYESEVMPLLVRSHDRDDSLQDFTKWMFIAARLVGISLVYNQGLLISICAVLENIETRGGMVSKYPTGGGKTDAVKRRLLVYELMASNASEAQRYRSELMTSITSKPDRKRAGNHALILVFKPDEEEMLAQWPEDSYATLRDQLSHHAHHTTTSPEQANFLEAIHGLFADIPYFAAILYRPLAIYYDQLMTWKATNPTSLNQLPQESNVLHSYLIDSMNARLEVQRDMKTRLYIVMIASKIMFLQSQCATLLSSLSVDLGAFQHRFFGLCRFFPGEFDGQDETAAIEQEWQWMFNFGFVAVLIHATCTGSVRKVNQDMYFEIAQRLEGSGKSYSKGGDRKPCTERRLVIVEHITGHFRRSRAPIPAEKVAAENMRLQVIHHSPPTDSNDSGKRRRVIKGLPDVVSAPSLPSQLSHLQSSAMMTFNRGYDMNELRRLAETTQDDLGVAEYAIDSVEMQEAVNTLSLMSVSRQGVETRERQIVTSNKSKEEVDANNLKTEEMDVSVTDDALPYFPPSTMLDGKEEELNMTTDFLAHGR